jgi:3-keto-5-aminohexanoate cleavage enzyme
MITAALTGGMHGKEANRALPEQPGEIIAAAVECYEAGAAIVHLHARDKEGRGTADPEIFKEINEGIRARCPLVVQDTTGDPSIPVSRRISSLEAAPDMASLNMGTVVFFVKNARGSIEEHQFVNLRSDIEAFARAMLDRGIKPELEVYSPAMFGEVENLIAGGLLRQPYYVNFVMNVSGMGAYRGTPRNLLTMVDHLPEGAIFNVSGIGGAQLTMSTMAILTGGHARVGLEDNIYYRKGELADSNARLVERVVRLAGELGREVATPEDARRILDI